MSKGSDGISFPILRPEHTFSPWTYFTSCMMLSLDHFPQLQSLHLESTLKFRSNFHSITQWPLWASPVMGLSSVTALNHGGRLYNPSPCVFFMSLKLHQQAWLSAWDRSRALWITFTAVFCLLICFGNRKSLGSFPSASFCLAGWGAMQHYCLGDVCLITPNDDRPKCR